MRSSTCCLLISGLLCAVCAPPAIAQAPAAASGKTVQVSFAADAVGREPKMFAPMVGSWLITKEAGANVLFIDGRVWKRGQPAGGLADKARELYGARNEEFIESIKAFAYYPIAVYKGLDNF